MNRRHFVTGSLSAAALVVGAKSLSDEVTWREVNGDNLRPYEFRWAHEYFDWGDDLVTTLVLRLPNGKIIRNAAHTSNIRWMQYEYGGEIEEQWIRHHKTILRLWAAHKHGVYLPR